MVHTTINFPCELPAGIDQVEDSLYASHCPSLCAVREDKLHAYRTHTTPPLPAFPRYPKCKHEHTDVIVLIDLEKITISLSKKPKSIILTIDFSLFMSRLCVQPVCLANNLGCSLYLILGSGLLRSVFFMHFVSGHVCTEHLFFIYIMVTVSSNVQRAPDQSRGFQLNKNNN